MKRFKVSSALRKPKDTKGNAKWPSVFVIAVFCLEGSQRFDGRHLPVQCSRRWCNRKCGGNSPVCVGLDTCPGWYEC